MKLGQFSAIVVVLGQFVVAEDAVVELFVDVPGADAVYENQFQASVVDACDNQTVLAMRRTDVHAATTDSVMVTATVNPTMHVAYAFRVMPNFTISIYESCALEGNTAADCWVTRSVVMDGNTTQDTLTTHLTGTDYNTFHVTLTAGAEKTTDAAKACTTTAALTSQHSATMTSQAESTASVPSETTSATSTAAVGFKTAPEAMLTIWICLLVLQIAS